MNEVADRTTPSNVYNGCSESFTVTPLFSVAVKLSCSWSPPHNYKLCLLREDLQNYRAAQPCIIYVY